MTGGGTTDAADSGGTRRHFECRCSWPRPGVAVVTVVGECDMSTAPQLRNELAHAIVDDPERLVVDLRGTTFIESSTLNALLQADRKLRRRVRRGICVVASEPARRVFAIAALDSLFEIVARLEDAVPPDG